MLRFCWTVPFSFEPGGVNIYAAMNPDLRFFELPDDVVWLCKLVGLERLCDPNVVIFCASDSGNEVAGRGVHEVTVGGSNLSTPACATSSTGAGASCRNTTVSTNLVAVASTHPCTMAVQGEPYAEMLHWASEEHYLLASRFVGDTKHEADNRYEFARVFSLTSGSLVRAAPGAARVLALTGAASFSAV